MVDALLMGRDADEVELPKSRVCVKLSLVRDVLSRRLNHDAASFSALSPGKQAAVVEKMERLIARELQRDPSLLGERHINLEQERAISAERNQLHHQLRPWAAGPLTLQKPQGSSYHHLAAYDDAGGHPVKMRHIHAEYGHEPELLVVENDWRRALAGRDDGLGVVRVPFPFSVWEFRVTDVRVLLFIRDEEPGLVLYACYGKNRVWVSDDHVYASDGTARLLSRAVSDARGHDVVPFSRVVELAWMQVRAACILMDVGATHRERVVAPAKLAEKRARSGTAPPRDYQVVRISVDGRHRPSRPAAARGASPATGGRSPQGGHLRRGTYVHYDDQDSGEEQYVNDGGFVVSKTWRKWHWAGDLSRMIEREYRL